MKATHDASEDVRRHVLEKAGRRKPVSADESVGHALRCLESCGLMIYRSLQHYQYVTATGMYNLYQEEM